MGTSAYYERNREKVLAKAKARYALKKDEILAKAKEYKEKTGYSTKYYAENKEYFSQKAREYYRNNPGRKYGLTKEEHEALLLQADNKCGICKMELTKSYIDHDHSTGKVRGVLCMHCNTVLGHAKDSIETLKSAIEYLEKK